VAYEFTIKINNYDCDVSRSTFPYSFLENLPSLLIDGETTDKRFELLGMKIEKGLKRLKQCNPEKYHGLETGLIRDLEDILRAQSNFLPLRPIKNRLFFKRSTRVKTSCS
jgi:hypothetical protein